jgi:nicotinamide phosphoribosyltransferase
MNTLFDNLILNTDSYKASHYRQYPQGTQFMSYYIESRGGDYDQLVFFGLQLFLKQYLLKPISAEMIDEAESILVPHGLPFNRADWEYILQTYDGFLPIAIEAMPEGMITQPGQVMAQIVNTDSRCFWLPGYLETMLLRAAWYGTTVATRSRTCKQLIAKYLIETADDLSGLDFKLHDFGARGVSSQESAAISGLAHLVNFKGTDTLAAIIAAQRYYHAEMPAYSIPAAEHSTITSWGRENEDQAYENMLQQFLAPGKLVAVVSDSYNLWQTLESWGTSFKAQIQNSGGTLVVRPDSGNPVEVVLKTLQMLEQYFGCTVNRKGYKVLPPCIRVIQGDGVSLSSIAEILETTKKQGYSADNLAFGMGAELLQKVNRDTLKFAMKASSVQINGVWQDVFKDPITDPGKQSKRGRLALISNAQDQLATISIDQLGSHRNLLQPVFRNGKLLVDDTFEMIRERAAV